MEGRYSPDTKLYYFTGRHPFTGLNSPSVIFKITEAERPARPWEAQELGLVDSVRTMTLSCWQENLADRLAMAEVTGFLREWSVVSLFIEPKH